MTRFLLTAALFVAGPLTAAGVPPCETAVQTKAYAAQVDERIKQIKPRMFVQMDTASKWTEVKDTPDSAAAVANVYVDPSGLPIAAFFSFAPAAKDWVQFANYYFRADGTLAKKNELLNTTHGRVSRSRETLFGCQGEELKATEQFVDLESKHKKKRPGDDFVDEPAPMFKKVEELPFYAALRRAP